MSAPGFQYRFVPGTSERTLLLLHGTGGDEKDLLPFGRAIDAAAALLSPRGSVSENGANRFFRRFAEGVFDEADVITRARQLADFIHAVAEQHHRSAITAVGYSNGANIAAAMMLLGLVEFAGAVLLRPMMPLTAPPNTNMVGQRTLISAGSHDPVVTVDRVNRLAQAFRDRGATVEVLMQPAGHELTNGDLDAVRDWLAAGAIA